MKKLLLFLILSLFLTACSSAGVAKEESFTSFKTVDLEGEEVTDSLFSEKDVTMVNFWGSTCGPCLGELDELSELHKRLPENVNLIGVLVDVPVGYEDGIKRSKTALAEAEASYQNLLLDEKLKEFTDGISLTPYTIFVNKEGKIVGKRIKGANVSGFISELEELVPDMKWKDE